MTDIEIAREEDAMTLEDLMDYKGERMMEDEARDVISSDGTEIDMG